MSTRGKMASSTTRTKTIRIRNEVAEYFEGKPLNRYVEGMYEYMLSGEIEADIDGIRVHRGVKVGTVTSDISEREYCAIEEMCRLYGVSVDELFKGVEMLMDRGFVRVEDGEVVSRDSRGYEVDGLYEACNEMGVDAEKVIKKCSGMIRNGKIKG